MPIAHTVAEAQVGDLLWLTRDYYRDERLVTVLKVARVYVTAGDPRWPQSAQEYRIDTGAIRTPGGYSPSCRVAGSKERTDRFWLSRAADLGKAITWSKDIETLKAVAFALGVEGPPDYSIEPPKEPEKP